MTQADQPHHPMMTLAEAAAAMGGVLVGADVGFMRVTTDSRAIQLGDLFVALKGERFDGHDYVATALAAGAAAVVVSEPQAASGPQVLVADTLVALGKLAGYWRGRFPIPLVALTGSNGKTTVKEMLASILRCAAGEQAVLATVGNLNNAIGMPLTLLQLHSRHRYAVIEMGMNHLGEIAYLSRIAKPDVALINNAGRAHVGEVGSLDGIAQAKGEIFQGLQPDGVALINADDAYAGYWKGLAGKHRILTFGLAEQGHSPDVSTRYQVLEEGVLVTFSVAGRDITARLQMAGQHNVRNAAAACAAAWILGVDPAHITQGLGAFSGVKGRLQRKPGLRGATLIDDSYNANPESMAAAVAVLAGGVGAKIFIMGDMGELGDAAPALHAEIGRLAGQAGIQTLFALGPLSSHACAAFGPGARHFESLEALIAALAPRLNADVTVLVKGSRFMQMERVVERLLAAAPDSKAKENH